MNNFSLILRLIAFFILSSLTGFAQLPAESDAFSLIAAYKKNDKKAGGYTKAYGQQTKFYPGYFTGRGNMECLVVYPIQQGKDFCYYAVLFYQNNGSEWKDGCWVEPGLIQVQVKDLNADGILEVLAQTRVFQNGREEGTYRVISLLGQKETTWYSNRTFSGNSFANAAGQMPGVELYRDILVIFEQEGATGNYLLKESIRSGMFSYYSDTTGVKLHYQNSQQTYRLTPGGYRKIP